MTTRWTLQSYLSGSVPLPWYGVPLSTNALDVLRYAGKSARAFGHHKLDTCHLLLELTDTSGAGTKALSTLDVTREAVRGEIENFHWLKGPESEDDSIDTLHPSHRTEEVIREAQEEAYVHGRIHARPLDLLLALTKGHTGCSSDQVFERLGLSTTGVHTQIARQIAGWRAEPHEHELLHRVQHLDDILTQRPPR